MGDIFRPTAQLKISLTHDCNNDCQFCLNQTTRSRKPRQRLLTIDKMRALVDEASALGMVGTYWTGGEPFIEYKSLLELIEYSCSKGLIPTVLTNGGLMGAHGEYKALNREILERAGLFDSTAGEIVRSLKEAGLVRIYFSVDSNHTTLKSPNENVANSVPAAVVSKAIGTCLEEGLGKRHELDAIGYQLRVTATSSGLWDDPTNRILEDVMGRVGLRFEKKVPPNAGVYGNEKGKLFLRRLGVSRIGDAAIIGDEKLENKAGMGLFDLKCPHFMSRKDAYDHGKYHGDLFVDHEGIVYTCGNHAYPVGNVFKESLSSIIKGINSPRQGDEYGRTRRVYHSLLLLAQNDMVADNAVGEAFRLIYAKHPGLIHALKTQCGGCHCLGHKEDMQRAFLEVFAACYDNSG